MHADSGSCDKMGTTLAATNTDRTVRFSHFAVNFASGELRKHGLRLKIAGQPIAILELLLDAPGELVTREQIRQRLWPADTFVDFEHGLNAAVNKLREALGDSADAPKFIETVPRRGYRFIGEIQSEPPAKPTPEPSVATVPEPLLAPPSKRSYRRVIYLALVLVLFSVAAVLYS